MRRKALESYNREYLDPLGRCLEPRAVRDIALWEAGEAKVYLKLPNPTFL